MLHRFAAILVAVFVLGACGSSDDGKAHDSRVAARSSSGAGSSATPTTTDDTAGAFYFTDAESNAINVVARRAQAAAARATSAANQARCNKVADTKGYPAWRACWHALLDPYVRALVGIGDELRALQAGTFPEGCIGSLKDAEGTFARFANRVRALLAGIDSDVRARQTRALAAYDATVRSIEAGYQKPFQALTAACYSPEQLAKLRSSSSTTPSP